MEAEKPFNSKGGVIYVGDNGVQLEATKVALNMQRVLRNDVTVDSRVNVINIDRVSPREIRDMVERMKNIDEALSREDEDEQDGCIIDVEGEEVRGGGGE